MATSDEELVSLSQQGDEQAVEELLSRYRGMVRSMAAGFTASPEEREDLLQEGMIGLWKAVQVFRQSQGSKYRALARVCVRRQMISALRKARASVEMPAGRQNSPAAWGLQERLLSALSSLERQVFERYLAGESYAVIAADLRISPKTVDNALQRARKKARRTYGLEEKRGGRRRGRLGTVGPA